jgi:hypothetical protein
LVTARCKVRVTITVTVTVAGRVAHLAALLGQLARGREDEGLHVAHGRVDCLQQPDAEDRGL